MMNTLEANVANFAEFTPALLTLHSQRFAYEQNHHRVYALAFWMADNELVAEAIMTAVFVRAFQSGEEVTQETIDRALVAEISELFPLGQLTLNCVASREVRSVRYNILRVELERAVVSLPATEKLIFLMHDVEGYEDARIAKLLELSQEQVKMGLHQARLRIRELLAR